MTYIINKIIDDDGIEYLPDITETPIWEDYDDISKVSTNIRFAAILYQAIQKRENYYQFNTPTPFGNPQYSGYCGRVAGILEAIEWTEHIENDKIVIYTSHSRLKKLIIDKVNKPKSYHETKREINAIMKDLI